jgi:hypothetical protein
MAAAMDGSGDGGSRQWRLWCSDGARRRGGGAGRHGSKEVTAVAAAVRLGGGCTGWRGSEEVAVAAMAAA